MYRMLAGTFEMGAEAYGIDINTLTEPEGAKSPLSATESFASSSSESEEEEPEFAEIRAATRAKAEEMLGVARQYKEQLGKSIQKVTRILHDPFPERVNSGQEFVEFVKKEEQIQNLRKIDGKEVLNGLKLRSVIVGSSAKYQGAATYRPWSTSASALPGTLSPMLLGRTSLVRPATARSYSGQPMKMGGSEATLVTVKSLGSDPALVTSRAKLLGESVVAPQLSPAGPSMLLGRTQVDMPVTARSYSAQPMKVGTGASERAIVQQVAKQPVEIYPGAQPTLAQGCFSFDPSDLSETTLVAVSSFVAPRMIR